MVNFLLAQLGKEIVVFFHGRLIGRFHTLGVGN